MRLPMNTHAMAVEPKGIVGLSMLPVMSYLLHIKNSSPRDKSVGNRKMEQDVSSQTELTSTVYSSYDNMEKLNKIATKARHLETKGVKLRLNSDLNHFLVISNGSLDINLGQNYDNTSCLQKHIFQVAFPDLGELVMLESNNGTDFLHANFTGDVGIENYPSENVTSVEETDNRFFKIYRRDIGHRFYVVQNLLTGHFLSTENNTISLIEESELESKTDSVEFDVYECDLASS